MPIQVSRPLKRRQSICPHSIIPPLSPLEKVVTLHNTKPTRNTHKQLFQRRSLSSVGAHAIDGDVCHFSRGGMLIECFNGGFGSTENEVMGCFGEVAGENCEEVGGGRILC